jgi:hypothetical protein
MKVHLTFDVEVWCGTWSGLDERFPAAFERYCYGRSPAGDYALPKTVEILRRYGLIGIFFVESLFSARFGAQWLQAIVDTIGPHDQDVQLHLHPEWTDEIRPPMLADISSKRQHLTYYTEDEQTILIGAGRRLLEAAKRAPVTAFRAGSFAANADTYRALAANGIGIDSSLNGCFDHSAGSLGDVAAFTSARTIDGVRVYPVTVLRDGFGRLRAAQLNGCSFAELASALLDAEGGGVDRFVIVSHNFEMLKPGSSEPDWFVVRRFEQLCRFLAERRRRFEVRAFDVEALPATPTAAARPEATLSGTARRYVEQGLRALR